jgi:protein-L-isoaspartate(D-aspartate) O-methyltransferase
MLPKARNVQNPEEKTTSLQEQRRFYSEEISMCCNVRTAALAEALSVIPREDFLPPGPWIVRGEGDFGTARRTPDSDPRHVYHNVSVAMDQARELYNGAPRTVVPWIDSLGLGAADRVLHVGCGLGYYTAIMAYIVGSTGYIRALEVDEKLAQQAKEKLSPFGQVDVRHGNGTELLEQTFDAALIHAGVTHPLGIWLEALDIGGRMILPVTATMPQMGTIGKGWTFILTKKAHGSFEAHPGNLIAIYSAIDIRDDGLNSAIGAALMKSPFPMVQRLRCDPHDPSASCWLHGHGFCLGTE